MDSDEIRIRPMTAEDADAVTQVTLDAFAASAERARSPVDPPSEDTWTLMRRRLHHNVATDPDGCWLAEGEGEPVGAAVALVREGLWILSLLMVRGDLQGQGVGRRLLERALVCDPGTGRGIIAASLDPMAWRRYWAAGFRLLPCAMAEGKVRRRDVIPVTPGLRDGRPDDYELAAEVDRALRGAAHGPDLELMAGNPGARFLVSDTAGDRGYVLTLKGSPSLLAAERPETARRLLWAALAEADDRVGVYFLSAEQDWAFDVFFSAGVTVRPGTALFVRGDLGPLYPYLPNGPFL